MKVYLIVDEEKKLLPYTAAPTISAAIRTLIADWGGLDSAWATLYAAGYRVATAELTLLKILPALEGYPPLSEEDEEDNNSENEEE